MNRVAAHVVVILMTGLIIGLIVRQRNIQRAQMLASEKGGIDAPAAKNVSPDPGPTVVGGSGWMSEFELTERSGNLVSSKDLLGQPYIVSFFFTTCPSTCSRQNDHLKILQEEFKGKDIRLLSISCDPEIDTPEVLSEYAKRFEADEEKWLFLTGDMDYIRRVGVEVYQLPVNRRFHTDRFVLVDSKGEISAYYEWPEPSQFDRLKVDLAKLLSGGEVGSEKAKDSET